jgi:hypothetical protein
MQVGVRPKPLFEKRPFPMPHCLFKDGKLQCEILMTLLYDCPVDRQHELEYCRRNVRASLGTISLDPQTGKETYTRELHQVPSKMHEHFDDEVYRFGHLWSPLKLYYRRFKNGPTKPWRLTLTALNRAEHVNNDEQQVVLLITIRSLHAADHVYDELVQEMNRLGWITADLQIQSRAGRQRAS